ncbi:ATP-binding protein [Elusimicrobiota bacterium]
MTTHEVSVEEFELLIETNRLLSSKLDLSELLYTVMDLASRVMMVEASSVLLVDEEKQELYFDVAVGGAGDELKGFRIPMGKGIAGWVAKENKPVIANDITKDPRWGGDAASEFKTKSILACPMQVRGKVIGVVEAINRAENNPFTFSDLRLFESFASQAGIAIENARLFSNLRTEKEKLEEIFNEMADAAILIDTKGKVLKANKQTKSFFEKELANISDTDKESYTWNPGRDDMFSSKDKGGIFKLTREDPKKLILAGTWVKIEDSYLLVFRDVTESQQEKYLKRDFLSMISHKLRTPLVTISGFMPLLKQESGNFSNAAKTALSAIEKEATHLNYLVEDILKFTSLMQLERASGIDKSPVVLSEVVEAALAKLGHLIKGLKVQVNKKMDNGSSTVGDKMLLTESISALIENAIKFNTKPEKTVTLEVRKEDPFLALDIVDNGPGIPVEEREKVFQWFQQVERDFTGQVRGMGLGLSFVKKVISLHDGKITLDSKLDEGTKFTLMLPAK